MGAYYTDEEQDQIEAGEWNHPSEADGGLSKEAYEKIVADVTGRYKHNPSLRYIDTAAGAIVIRSPTQPEFNRWHDAAYSKNAQEQRQGGDDMARKLVVYPDKSEYEELLKTLPGINLTVVDIAIELAGVVGRNVQKKRSR